MLSSITLKHRLVIMLPYLSIRSAIQAGNHAIYYVNHTTLSAIWRENNTQKINAMKLHDPEG